MYWTSVACCVVVLIFSGIGDGETTISHADAQKLLSKLFEASSKQNINSVFTVEQKGDELILESTDAKVAALSNRENPQRTVEFVLGADDSEETDGSSNGFAEVNEGKVESDSNVEW
ncbi:unnamed protein product [Nippostrongylus brasiliensis]|uniref:RxLR effector protein n=1 Tax=Nippostrongylus brasiliensis TaxID=27835 RepID=A0A0N4YBK2_NIPBR|nr:unnamed protein product [Nippostrongylus brasiliensis]